MLLTLFNIYFTNCQRNKKVINEEDKSTQIKEILKNQLQFGRPNYSNPYEYTNKDFEITLAIVKEILKSKDYKFPSSEEFNKRIKSVFKRTIDIKSESKYLYVNFLNRCDRNFIYFPNNIYAYFGVYSIKNDNYITDSYALPQIINYQKMFPEIANIENYVSKSFVFENGEEVSRYLWKDDKNLIVNRQNNIETLVNRNKYLFNDNKSSLVWLKTHDAFFLESLVKTFGYVQDKDLLKWVLDKNLLKNSQDDVEEFAKILGTRNCDGKIEVHKEVFDFMLTQNEIEREKYAASLLLFRDYYKNTGKDLSFSELTKIRAIVCYYGTKMSDNYFYSFFPYLHSEKYAEEFKKNNYYDISDFKELYEDAKYGGINEPY